MTEKAFRAIIGTWETLLFHWPRLVVLGCVGITFGGDRQFWAWLPRVVHSAHLEGMPMKNRLIYQSSEYDCGPTSVTNAIRFLFERAEIPPAVLKHIWIMGIDTFSADGEPGKEGTSKASMRYLAALLEIFAEQCGFPIKSTFLDMDFATVQPGSLAWRCLERKGCVVMRCSLGGDGHYVLLTRIISEEKIGLFDPYQDRVSQRIYALGNHQHQHHGEAAHHTRPNGEPKAAFMKEPWNRQPEVDHAADPSDKGAPGTDSGTMHLAPAGQGDDDGGKHTNEAKQPKRLPDIGDGHPDDGDDPRPSLQGRYPSLAFHDD